MLQAAEGACAGRELGGRRRAEGPGHDAGKPPAYPRCSVFSSESSGFKSGEESGLHSRAFRPALLSGDTRIGGIVSGEIIFVVLNSKEKLLEIAVGKKEIIIIIKK